MTDKEMLEIAMYRANITQTKAASLIGWSQTRLSERLRHGRLGVNDMSGILEKLGMELQIVYKETGEAVKAPETGYGRRVVRRIPNNTKYDTAKADALSNTFYEDGENEYNSEGYAIELYVDRKGRHFFAKYFANEEQEPYIRTCSPGVASKFIKKHGTDLKKDKKAEKGQKTA